jgi:hypothetical protein
LYSPSSQATTFIYLFLNIYIIIISINSKEMGFFIQVKGEQVKKKPKIIENGSNK